MIPQYKLNGYNIVLDVYSGSVHAVDDVAYDAIALLDAGNSRPATAAALADLDLASGRAAGGTARFYVSDTPDTFAELETLFLGEYAGGPVEQIAIENY